MSEPTIERILAVDDDPNNLMIVELSLKRAGYDVMTAQSASDALTLVHRRGMPHLVVSDLNMPIMNGFELAEKLHEFSDVPIVMLTAVDEESTVIQGIERFAEDYIIKPFSPGELVARVRRVLRRMGTFAYTLDPIVDIDDYLQLDFPGRRAIVEGKDVSLTPTETKLLYLLMRNAGQIVTSDFLVRRIWPFEEAYEVRLHVHIHRLRRKIEKDPKNPYYVVSERGAGYVFPKNSKA